MDQRAETALANEQDGEAIDLAKLKDAPSGAFALAGVAVGLLILAWLLIYFFVFIPRGSVG